MRKFLHCDRCGNKTTHEVHGVPICPSCKDEYLEDEEIMKQQQFVPTVESLIDLLQK